MTNPAAFPLDADVSGAYSTELRLTTDGRIVDFLDPDKARPNTPEERVRQVYARRLHYDYGYPKSHMAFEVPIQIFSAERGAADIVVYVSELAAKMRDQSKIRVIVEAKAPNVQRGRTQLLSYIYASSAEGGVWMNETDAPVYWRRGDGPGQELTTWPNIPRFGELWESVGTHSKRALRPPHNLVETFRRCHNALYRQGIDSEDIAMDMVRIILAKYQDEKNAGEECKFRCTPLELQTAEGRNRVAERVHTLFREARAEAPEVFDSNEEISAGDREIATVVSELQDFQFLADDESEEVYDVVGAAYEVYVGSHLKGDRGQYFTPRLIVQLLTRSVAPSAGDTIIDPAMGSGGFLIMAMRLITHAITKSDRSPRAKRDAIRAMQQRLFGIDQSSKLVKVARMNMILAADGRAGLVRGDSLHALDELPASFRPRRVSVPTVILTNPPFGATSEHRITPDNDPDVIGQYALGRVWRADARGRLRPSDEFATEGAPPEYLFIERCIRWLAPGGKLGVVVPRGVLDNDKALPLRTLLLREMRVLAVINCHDDTFKPHTDAKAALLYCEKKDVPTDDDDDYPIYMAISQGIGHDGLGRPIYRTDSKGDPILVGDQPVLDQDTGDIYEGWLALREGRQSPSEYYFQSSRHQLTPSLHLNPVRYLPRYEASRRAALELGERDGWTSERLGQIARVFNGPRFKRPYADRGTTRGPDIVRYFTGNAATQMRGENLKFLDLAKAKPQQLKMINKLYLQRGMILITDSGTVGRVVYATRHHEGAVGTNNLIRIVIDDEALRGYVYQYLLSPMGQNQLKANIYGAIVDHIEPDDVKQVIVPIPDSRERLEEIGLKVIRAVELQEAASRLDGASRALLAESLGENVQLIDGADEAEDPVRDDERETDLFSLPL
jgi:type I restriction enzyme M protein